MAKIPIYIRIDEDTLDWFRHEAPRGYQTRMNEVLAEYKKTQEHRLSFLLGRAQELFRQYHARCFWHLRKEMQITAELLPLVREGLRKHGGRQGFMLAAELDLNPPKSNRAN